jgi:Na+-translocating ferredoxin:NAD+ oxidoreductase subunit A
MGNLFWILISSALVSNFTLTLFLGLCSFVGVTQKTETAVRLGLANTFVMTMTAVTVWFLNRFILAPAPYLRIIAFIVVIASLVQIVEMLIKKTSPALFRALGIYLPLITTNCGILYLAIVQTNRSYTLLEGIAFAIGAGGGLTLALTLMASIRERLELSNVPALARGMAIVFLIAGCLSLAFMGFAGLFTS